MLVPSMAGESEACQQRDTAAKPPTEHDNYSVYRCTHTHTVTAWFHSAQWQAMIVCGRNGFTHDGFYGFVG